MGLGIPTLCPRMAYPETQVKAWNGAELGPWHHSTEMTLETVDMRVLQEDLRVYVGLVSRFSNEAVFPHDFTAVGEEMVKRLEELVPKAPPELSLGTLQERARRFQCLATQLERRMHDLRQRARWPLTAEVLTANRALMRISRILTAPTSTISGKWDQDLYGLEVLRTVFPALYPIEELAQMDPEDLKFRLLRTRLVRERNWIADCLKAAIEVAEATVEAM